MQGGVDSALPALGQVLSFPPCLRAILHPLRQSWGCTHVAPRGRRARGSRLQQAGQRLGLLAGAVRGV